MKKYVTPMLDTQKVSFADVITLSAFGSKATGSGVDWDWSTPVSIEDGINV